MGVIASIAKVSYTTDLHIYWQCSKCGNINEKSITISEKGVGFQPGRNARTQTAGNHAQFMAFSSINQYLKTAEAAGFIAIAPRSPPRAVIALPMATLLAVPSLWKSESS